MCLDIIVHVRNTSYNLLAVEMKANANTSKSRDLDKLRSLHSEAAYLYKGTAFVRVFNGTSDISEGPCGRRFFGTTLPKVRSSSGSPSGRPS